MGAFVFNVQPRPKLRALEIKDILVYSLEARWAHNHIKPTLHTARLIKPGQWNPEPLLWGKPRCKVSTGGAKHHTELKKNIGVLMPNLQIQAQITKYRWEFSLTSIFLYKMLMGVMQQHEIRNCGLIPAFWLGFLYQSTHYMGPYSQHTVIR